MRTEHIFVICIRMKADVSHKYKWFKSLCSFSTDSSKAVPLLQFFFVSESTVVSYVAFLLPLFVSYLSFVWCCAS